MFENQMTALSSCLKLVEKLKNLQRLKAVNVNPYKKIIEKTSNNSKRQFSSKPDKM